LVKENIKRLLWEGEIKGVFSLFYPADFIFLQYSWQFQALIVKYELAEEDFK